MTQLQISVFLFLVGTTISLILSIIVAVGLLRLDSLNRQLWLQQLTFDESVTATLNSLESK